MNWEEHEKKTEIQNKQNEEEKADEEKKGRTNTIAHTHTWCLDSFKMWFSFIRGTLAS